MSVFNFRSNHKIKKKTNLSYQEICNSLTKRQIVKCKNTLRANNDQIFIALFSQNELLFQVCLTLENTASPVSRDFLTPCSSLGKRGGIKTNEMREKNLIASTLQTTGCGSKNRNKRNTNISADIRKFNTPYYYFLNISPFNIAR